MRFHQVGSWHTTGCRRHTSVIAPRVIASRVSMQSYVAKTVSRCFAVLRWIRSIHRQSPGQYCNRSSSHWCWHSWITAAQLLPVCCISYSTDFSLLWTQPLDWFSLSGSMIMSLPLLHDLHWSQRIKYCLAVLAFRCQHGMTPSYLLSQLRHKTHKVSILCGSCGLITRWSIPFVKIKLRLEMCMHPWCRPTDCVYCEQTGPFSTLEMLPNIFFFEIGILVPGVWTSLIVRCLFQYQLLYNDWVRLLKCLATLTQYSIGLTVQIKFFKTWLFSFHFRLLRNWQTAVIETICSSKRFIVNFSKSMRIGRRFGRSFGLAEYRPFLLQFGRSSGQIGESTTTIFDWTEDLWNRHISNWVNVCCNFCNTFSYVRRNTSFMIALHEKHLSG